jgi:putative transposase
VADTFTNLLVHIVFSTKNREPLITPVLRPELEKYLGGILRNEGGSLLEIGTMPDHVHLLVKLRADASVSDSVRVLKSNSSKWANARFPGFAWQNGYGAFSVSESQSEAIRLYLRRQEEHHRGVTFQEEFVAFLRRHGIEFQETYLWV